MELTATTFSRNLAIEMLNQSVSLAAVVRCFLPTMRFNARRSPSVSLTRITLAAGGFSALLEFRDGH